MAEPQRAPALPDVPSRARPRQRPRHSARRKPLLDETENLSPPIPGVARTLPPATAEAASPGRPAPLRRSRLPPVQRTPPRSPGEWTLVAVVLVGLALNAWALLTGSALTPADRNLGSAVLLAGVVLLVMMELCRRPGRGAR